MFVFLRDYLKKLSNDLNNESLNNVQDEIIDDVVNDSSSNNIEDISNIVDDETNNDNDNLVNNKEIKQKRKNALREASRERRKEQRSIFKRTRHRSTSIYSLCLLLLFVAVLSSSVKLLTSPTEFNLKGFIYYSAIEKSYIIKYDIEELWNDNNLGVGAKVCTPDYFDKFSSATNEKRNSDCIAGEVIEANHKVKIDYGLPKRLKYEELKLYISKQNFSKNISNVIVTIKSSNGRYLITEIKPIKNTP